MSEVAPIDISEAPALDEQQGIDWWLQARRAGAGLAMAGAAFAGGAVVGDMLLPTNVELGPHNATAQLTLENRLQVDLGPLGAVSAPSPLHVGIFHVGGVKVTVKEIPDGDGAALGPSELTQYEEFFSAPGRTSNAAAIESALITRGLESGGAAVLVGGGLLWLMGGRGREVLGEAARSRRTQAAAAVALSMAVLTSSGALPHTPAQTYDAVLEANGIHGVQVEGKVLETLLDKYGPTVIDHIKKTDAYYNDIKDTLLAAYKDRLKEEEQEPTELSAKIADGDAEQVVWISDNHCNTGTSGLTADLAHVIKPVFILDTGDQTMGGTQAEKRCVAVLAQETKGIPKIVSLGNHDDHIITAEQDKSVGFTVLAGKPVQFEGYTILGDVDVERSAFGVPFRLWGSETAAQAGARIAKVACASHEKIDILAMHEPDQGLPTAEQGCAKLVADGHTHEPAGPIKFVDSNNEVSYQLVNGTTGGAAENKMTFESTLGKESTTMILIFDKATKDPLGYRQITVFPDKSVKVGDLVAYKSGTQVTNVPKPTTSPSH